MVQLGIMGLVYFNINISMESHTETTPSWQLDQVEKSLDQLTMVHLGVVLLLEFHQIIASKESPSGTIPLWQLDKQAMQTGIMELSDAIRLSEMRSLDQLTKLQVGLNRILLITNVRITMESATGAAIPLWQLVRVERSIDQLTVVHLGII